MRLDTRVAHFGRRESDVREGHGRRPIFEELSWKVVHDFMTTNILERLTSESLLCVR